MVVDNASIIQFEAGDRVSTPSGDGKVMYCRFGQDFINVAAYSVLLDSKLNIFGYAGSIFPADKVGPVEIKGS